MASDFILLGYQKVLSLLTAGGSATATTFTGTNRIKWIRFDGQVDQPERQHVKQTDCFPEIIADVDSFTDSGMTLTRVFATASGTAASWEQKIEVVYRLKISLDNVKLSTMTAITTTIRTDLLNAGVADLGVTGCKMFVGKQTFRNRRTSRDDDSPGHRRRIGELLIPASIAFRGETQTS